ncbi:PREDICTED: adhesion G-protein coupled receptor G2-like [Amphimedon queenslandica]|uniref:G-protein coupled receptors family 2 profile 2 domain-containing protein n=1 Tax=Amphimedon queenslandica TaxID=400682 RepID=A0AAN0JDL8_AMPQE|nr:PREDICTED: adhesion G-protein coupled receptor G2-like [Amphimedon queenslandica]|eukprot:XP_019855094.1 PREDICTED: adhesion G-protein coupled receptor G2-like [Amphimedon queenslandica]
MKVSVILALCAGAGMILGLLSGSGAVALIIYYFLHLEKHSPSHMNAQTTQSPATLFSSSYLATSSVVILPSTSSQAISSVSSSTVPSSSYTSIHMSPSPTVSQGFCVSETIVNDRGTFQWPVTPVGSLANLPCPHGPIGARAIRQCRRNGVWDTHDISNCADPGITAAFVSLARTNITINNVVFVCQELSALISQVTEPGNQNSNNLISTSFLLNKIALLFSDPGITFELFSTEFITIIIESVVQVLDGVSYWPPIVLGAQSNVIVQSFERIVDALISQENFTNLTIIETGIAFQGLRIERTGFIGITFIGSSINGSLSINLESRSNRTQESGFYLPGSIRDATNRDDIILSFLLYNRSTLFPICDVPSDTVVGSTVIGASVGGIPDGTVLPDNVTINFTITQENATNHRCVYWDFSASGGRGNWSVSGCTTHVINISYVTCVCNHLTSFACLVDVGIRDGSTPPTPVQHALEAITIIGSILSLLGLALTIITLIIFKKFRKRDVSKFHVQLCLSLIFMLIVFVVGIDRVSVRAGCITVGVLIHYFALVSWMWMGAEAVLMFQKLVIVFSTITWKYILTVSLVCWGIPLLPLTITVSIDPNFYVFDNSTDQINFCFIGEMVPFVTAFLIPVFLILLFNLVVFAIIIVVVIKHNVDRNRRLGRPSMTTKEAIKMLIPLTGVMLLCGLTWIFGIFTFISEPGVSYTVQFLFAFFNAFQGFFIFLFFVIFSGESRDAWNALFCQEKKTNSSASNNKTMITASSRSNINKRFINNHDSKTPPNVSRLTSFTDTDKILQNSDN